MHASVRVFSANPHSHRSNVGDGLSTIASVINIPLTYFALASGQAQLGLSAYAFGAVRGMALFCFSGIVGSILLGIYALLGRPCMMTSMPKTRLKLWEGLQSTSRSGTAFRLTSPQVRSDAGLLAAHALSSCAWPNCHARSQICFFLKDRSNNAI